MKTFKRILTILLAFVLLTAVLCGCKGGKSGKDEPKETAAPASEGGAEDSPFRRKGLDPAQGRSRNRKGERA